MSLQDLKIPDSRQLTPNPDNPFKICGNVITYSRNIAIDAFNWYAWEKKRKQQLA